MPPGRDAGRLRHRQGPARMPACKARQLARDLFGEIAWRELSAPRDEEHLRRLVSQAFTQRRKAISNSLNSQVTLEQFEQAGIDAGLRPDQLSVADYVALANITRPEGGTA